MSNWLLLSLQSPALPTAHQAELCQLYKNTNELTVLTQVLLEVKYMMVIMITMTF